MAVRMGTNGGSHSDTLKTLFIANDAAGSDINLMLPMFIFDSALSPSFMSSSLVSLTIQGIQCIGSA